MSISSAHALTIDPMRVELAADPGSKQTLTLTLANPDDINPVTVSVSPDEYRYVFSAQTGFPDGDDQRRLPSCTPWISLEPARVTIPPKGQTTLTLHLECPADADQEHVAALVFDQEEDTPTDNSGPADDGQVNVIIHPRISIPVYVWPQPESLEAKIVSTSVETDENRGCVLSAVVQNTGSRHLRLFGTVSVMTPEGEVLVNLPTGRTGPVFPEFSERLGASYPRVEAGRYVAVFTIEYAPGQVVQKKMAYEISADGEARIVE